METETKKRNWDDWIAFSFLAFLLLLGFFIGRWVIPNEDEEPTMYEGFQSSQPEKFCGSDCEAIKELQAEVRKNKCVAKGGTYNPNKTETVSEEAKAKYKKENPELRGFIFGVSFTPEQCSVGKTTYLPNGLMWESKTIELKSF